MNIRIPGWLLPLLVAVAVPVTTPQIIDGGTTNTLEAQASPVAGDVIVVDPGPVVHASTKRRVETLPEALATISGDPVLGWTWGVLSLFIFLLVGGMIYLLLPMSEFARGLRRIFLFIGGRRMMW